MTKATFKMVGYRVGLTIRIDAMVWAFRPALPPRLRSTGQGAERNLAGGGGTTRFSTSFHRCIQRPALFFHELAKKGASVKTREEGIPIVIHCVRVSSSS